MEYVNKRRRSCLSLSKQRRYQRNQFQGNSPTFDIFSKLEKTRQSNKMLEFIFKLMFSLPSPSSVLRLPYNELRNRTGEERRRKHCFPRVTIILFQNITFRQISFFFYKKNFLCKRPKNINVKLIDLSLLSSATLSPSSPSCQQDSRKKKPLCVTNVVTGLSIACFVMVFGLTLMFSGFLVFKKVC